MSTRLNHRRRGAIKRPKSRRPMREVRTCQIELLEARELLAADFTLDLSNVDGSNTVKHDVIIRLNDQGNANPADDVIEFGELVAGSFTAFTGTPTALLTQTIEVQGTDQADSVTIDDNLSSAPPIGFDGGAGTDTLNAANHNTNWAVSASTPLPMPLTADLTVTAVEVLNGGSAVDTLSGDDVANAWVISTANAGLLNGQMFTGIENVTGGGDVDTFSILDGGSLSGAMGIDGGAGTDDEITVPNNAAVTTGPGTVTVGGAPIRRLLSTDCHLISWRTIL